MAQKKKNEKLICIRFVNMIQQLLLPLFSMTFAAAKRKTQAAIRAFKDRLRADSLSGYSLLFEPALSSSLLLRCRRDSFQKKCPYATLSSVDENQACEIREILFRGELNSRHQVEISNIFK